jgi:hypothetical protein
MVLLMLFLLFRIIFRRPWIAAGAFLLLWTGWIAAQWSIWSSSPSGLAIGVLTGALDAAVMLTLLIRFGLVAFLSGVSFFMLGNFPFPNDPSAPYFAIGLVPIVITLALAVYGFRVSLAGQPVFGDDLLGVGAAPKR